MNKKPVIILGLSFFYHDSAAAISIDGIIRAAAQEERFTRKKADESFPINSINFCLKEAGISIYEVDYIAFYEKPILKFIRLIFMYLRSWPRGLRSFLLAMQALLTKKLWIEHTIRKTLGYKGKILYSEHHLSHAASAYYASPFTDATLITIDGVGEEETTTIGKAEGNTISLSNTINFPHSLGMLYSALTYYLGFKVNSAEYKVMGLAPYGRPEIYKKQFEKLVHVKEDGSYRLDMRYFSYEYSLRMTNRKFDNLFGGPARKPESPLTMREKDIAAGLQETTEDIILRIVSHARKLHPSENLCLAGGVALNCVANGKILRSGLYKNIYIQPAAGDAGGAVGAALLVHYEVLGNPKKGSAMFTAYLGTSYDRDEIIKFLETEAPTILQGKKPVYTIMKEAERPAYIASLIEDDRVVGVFDGKMEFGPRSLGNRSIIADPRKKENWQRVNLKIKFRESFRPFAPIVIREKVSTYFDINVESPYMLLVAPVKATNIPAVTHVDNSARIQTLTRDENPFMYSVLQAFEAKTGCPVLINTSFNVRGEPIVESPRDALWCFLNSDIDDLVLGNIHLSKKDNGHLLDKEHLKKYLQSFILD